MESSGSAAPKGPEDHVRLLKWMIKEFFSQNNTQPGQEHSLGGIISLQSRNPLMKINTDYLQESDVKSLYFNHILIDFLQVHYCGVRRQK